MEPKRPQIVVKNSPANAGDIRDVGSIPGSGRPPGGGNGNLLQYSSLENPMDRGAWQGTVQRVTKSQTRLSNWTTYHSPPYSLQLVSWIWEWISVSGYLHKLFPLLGTLHPPLSTGVSAPVSPHQQGLSQHTIQICIFPASSQSPSRTIPILFSWWYLLLSEIILLMYMFQAIIHFNKDIITTPI